MRKTLIAVLALSVAAAFTPSFAAGPVGPGSKIETESAAQVVKAKKKVMKKVKKSGKKAKSKPGSCGAYMYYSKKTKKCMDARAKK
ncbi:MAG: hypothetical protein NW223_05600 [Hyphomicrobiaceae bacterium]|nr:hypothetical protein [Hyphomicrobiaceae bacterium]